MKRIIAILLLTGILFQAFNKVIIFVDYEINKDFIAKNLCENKDKPKLHCNGKCHMMKKMTKAEKRENAPVNNLKNKSQVQLYPETNLPFGFRFEPIGRIYFTELPVEKSSAYSAAIYHPPRI